MKIELRRTILVPCGDRRLERKGLQGAPPPNQVLDEGFNVLYTHTSGGCTKKLLHLTQKEQQDYIKELCDYIALLAANTIILVHHYDCIAQKSRLGYKASVSSQYDAHKADLIEAKKILNFAPANIQILIYYVDESHELVPCDEETFLENTLCLPDSSPIVQLLTEQDTY